MDLFSCDFWADAWWFWWCGSDRPISLVGNGSAGIPVNPIIPSSVSEPSLIGLLLVALAFLVAVMMARRVWKTQP